MNRFDVYDAMDFVTSDEYVANTGDDYFYQKHADIITENFDGDWSWYQAVDYWSQDDLDRAVEIYKLETAE